MSRYYILDESHSTVPSSLHEWATVNEARHEQATQGDDPWRVKRETVGEFDISTVFLGLDHSWGDGPPLLFETMIFGGEHDGYQDRCSTWAEAEAMHAKAVEHVSTQQQPTEGNAQ